MDWLKPISGLPWGLNVEVVLPVPLSPMIRMSLRSTWPRAFLTGVILAPACSISPPSRKTLAFSIRSPPFFDSPK